MIVVDPLGPHGHLMVVPDGIVAWRSPAHFGAGDMTYWKAIAHGALEDWAPGDRISPLAEAEAFRVRGTAESVLFTGPSVRAQTWAAALTGRHLA